jgi:membrane fusion protein, multidrug efflux system
MKRKNITAIAFGIILTLINSCVPSEKKEVSGESGNESRDKEPVKIMELQYQTISRSVEYPANLIAYEEVHLAPASPGRIEEIHAEVGDRVAKGDVLVQMDRTQLHQAEVQFKNLEADFRRLDTLAKYGSIAEQQYDQLQTQYEVAQSNVEFLSENTRLTAPFNGIITDRYFEPGELYSGTPNTQAGKAAVLSIAQVNRLKAVVSLSENYFPMVKNGMKTTISTDTYKGRKFSGRVFLIHPTIDPVNRTFDVEVLINNSKRELRPGMFCRVTFDLDEIEAILVPAIAVLKMQGSNERYLFTASEGKANRISVKIGERYDDKIEVVSNELQQGDLIIVSGQGRLLDETPIEVVN